MFKKSIVTSFAMFIAAALPTIAQAETHNFTIINHFDDRLYFNVNINQGGVPGLPQNFSLGINDTITTDVVENGGHHAYIRVFDQTEDKRAFFGVELAKDKLIYHRYVTHKIAYTFGENNITFCTMDEVMKNGHC